LAVGLHSASAIQVPAPQKPSAPPNQGRRFRELIGEALHRSWRMWKGGMC
jgi:hypothetical protein